MSDYAEIDPNTGEVVDNLKSKASYLEHRLKAFHNSYTGNKRKIIPHILQFIDHNNISYNTVLDLFCGSAYASLSFKMIGKKVACNDLMASSVVNALALVANNNIVLSKKEKESLRGINSSLKKVIDLEFYSDRISENEISLINNYYNNAVRLFGPFSISNIKFALAMYPLLIYILKHCYIGGRLNCGQILAEYDYRIKHKRNKGWEMFVAGDYTPSYRQLKWPSLVVPNDKNIHFCHRLDASVYLKNVDISNIDLCYIDPPYGDNQSDYFKMYDILERIVLGEEYNTQNNLIDQSKKFVHKLSYEQHFRELIHLCKKIPVLVISYNDNSWGSLEKIIDVIGEFRNEITHTEINHAYKYRNQKKNTSKTKEYVIIAK